MTDISNKLVRIRREHGYSQAELSEILGVSQPQISNYEMGKTRPSALIERKIDRLSAKRLEGETGFGE
jgi:transcriptional regulator with XRE-family HTH domain